MLASQPSYILLAYVLQQHNFYYVNLFVMLQSCYAGFNLLSSLSVYLAKGLDHFGQNYCLVERERNIDFDLDGVFHFRLSSESLCID